MALWLNRSDRHCEHEVRFLEEQGADGKVDLLAAPDTLGTGNVNLAMHTIKANLDRSTPTPFSTIGTPSSEPTTGSPIRPLASPTGVTQRWPPFSTNCER